MKNTQVIQLMSIVWLSIFMLGITMMSCSSKKEQQLPAIGKSVALFDYFSYINLILATMGDIYNDS